MGKEEYIVFGFDSKIRLCPYCVKATNLLEERGMAYTFLNVLYNEHETNKFEVDNNRSELLKLLNVDDLKGITFPQIFIKEGGQFTKIGGFSELKKLFIAEEIFDL